MNIYCAINVIRREILELVKQTILIFIQNKNHIWIEPIIYHDCIFNIADTAFVISCVKIGRESKIVNHLINYFVARI